MKRDPKRRRDQDRRARWHKAKLRRLRRKRKK